MQKKYSWNITFMHIYLSAIKTILIWSFNSHAVNTVLNPGKCFFVAAVLFAFWGTSYAQQEYAPAVEARIGEVEGHLTGLAQIKDSNNYNNLQQRMKTEGVNGLSIVVINNYKIEWAKSYGFADVASGKKTNNETLFQAASNSKSLNAVGLLKLAQLKKIDLNTDINTYFRSWQFPCDSLKRGQKNYRNPFAQPYCRYRLTWIQGIRGNSYLTQNYTNIKRSKTRQ